MKPEVKEIDTLLLCGFSFFGDPFSRHSAWTEENEIGQLWKRLTGFRTTCAEYDLLAGKSNNGYEAHIWDDNTFETGCYEIFAGYRCPEAVFLSDRLLYKVIPKNTYAVFRLNGSEISGDVFQDISQKWLPESGLEQSGSYSLNLYAAGDDSDISLECGSIDVLIPVKRKS